MTAPATVSAGLVDIDAPLPSPRQFDLLAAASLVETEQGAWLRGAMNEGYPPGPASTFDPCSRGTLRVKPVAGPIPSQMAGAFQVILAGECTAQGVGANRQYVTDRLKLAFQAVEGQAVERVLVGGGDVVDGSGTSTLGSYLGDPNMEVLNGGSATTPSRAMQLLEDEIASHGIMGMIHATPATVTAWAEATLVSKVGTVLRTTLGTPVVQGAGYLGAVPYAGSAPASDQAWAFASGPIEIRRQLQIDTIPATVAQALNREMNDIAYFAERAYIINWTARQDATDEDHTQAGVLVDLVP